MIVLVIMGIRWKVDVEVSGFKYSFFDHVITGYSRQDHVQVEDVIQLAVDTVQDRHPSTKSLSFIQTMQVIFPHNN